MVVEGFFRILPGVKVNAVTHLSIESESIHNMISAICIKRLP